MGIENEIKLLENLNFNLGAMILAPIWLYFHNEKILALISLIFIGLSQISPISGLPKVIIGLVAIVIALYCGIKGNEIAMDSGNYSTKEEMKYSQNKWLRWGIYTGAVLIILNFVGSYLASGLTLFKIDSNAVNIN